jgi:hypothetical protein
VVKMRGNLLCSASTIVPSEGAIGGFKVYEVEGVYGIQERLVNLSLAI